MMLPILNLIQYYIPFLNFVPEGTDYFDWLNFIALDFGVRLVVMISTAVAVLLLVLTIDFCPWIHNSLHQHGQDVIKSSIYLTLAAIFEVINATIINFYFFRPLKIDLFLKIKMAFGNIKFAVLVIAIGTSLFINIVYTFTENNKFS
jgi:hypothetical protein